MASTIKPIIYILLSLGAVFAITACKSSKIGGEKEIYSLNFDSTDDLSFWVPECEGGAQELSIKNGKLDIDASKGATVWFKEKIKAPVVLEYTAIVVDQGGTNDRVSDLNCFWMATDPRCEDDIFSCDASLRKGKFSDYHTLKTYYVGYGGHNNTKSRFRRYIGTGERPLLPEHDLSSPLITANQPMKVRIEVKDNLTTYSIDGKMLFEMQDENPYQEGWFAFRTVRNHMQIEEFKINSVKE